MGQCLRVKKRTAVQIQILKLLKSCKMGQIHLLCGV